MTGEAGSASGYLDEEMPEEASSTFDSFIKDTFAPWARGAILSLKSRIASPEDAGNEMFFFLTMCKRFKLALKNPDRGVLFDDMCFPVKDGATVSAQLRLLMRDIEQALSMLSPEDRPLGFVPPQPCPCPFMGGLGMRGLEVNQDSVRSP